MLSLFVLNQLLFLFALHRFDEAFSFHGADSIRLRLNINQFHGTPRTRVTRAASGIMRFEASFGVGRPAGIECPI